MMDVNSIFARKRAERLATEPSPKTVITEEELRDFGVVDAPPLTIPQANDRRTSELRSQQKPPVPHSEDAERGILSSIMQGGAKTMFLVEQQIGAEHFYDDRFAMLYSLLEELQEASYPLDDLIAVTEYAEKTGRLEQIGGVATITDIYTFVPSASNVSYYVSIVQEKYALREVWKLSRKMEANALLSGVEATETIEQAMESLRALQGIGGRNGRLPSLDDMTDITGENRPPSPPELVKGLLHQGSKIIIGGTSKGRKTFALMDLAVSVATGSPWWDMETVKGRVCYINFEIQKPFFVKRYEDICNRKRVKPDPKMFMCWTLRGMVDGIEKMSDQLLKSLLQYDFSLIVVDPIYKALGDRDENKAGDVASLLNELERIAVRTGAAIAFGAHYSKGNQAAKESIDRIGGSGVFARDPDAILTMTPHTEPECFIVDSTLRNFPPKAPFVVKWDWPIFEVDDYLNPEDIKQPKKVSRTSETGQFEKKYSVENILETLQEAHKDGVLPAELQRLTENYCGMKKSKFWMLWSEAKKSPFISTKNGRYFYVFQKHE